MQSPNRFGAYPVEQREEVARHGGATATIAFCHCDDGLYRCAISIHWSTGGSGEPISAEVDGYATLAAAREGGLQRFLARWPTGCRNDPQSVRDELRAMKDQLLNLLRQPTLF